MEKFTGSMNETVKKIKMESKVDLNEDLLLFEELDVSGYRAVIPGALECIICAATGWVCPGTKKSRYLAERLSGTVIISNAIDSRGVLPCLLNLLQ
jgi:hypothetical protein